MKLKWSLSPLSPMAYSLSPSVPPSPSGHEKMQTIFNFNWKVVACITLCTFSLPLSISLSLPSLSLSLYSSMFLSLLRHSESSCVEFGKLKNVTQTREALNSFCFGIRSQRALWVAGGISQGLPEIKFISNQCVPPSQLPLLLLSPPTFYTACEGCCPYWWAVKINQQLGQFSRSTANGV